MRIEISPRYPSIDPRLPTCPHCYCLNPSVRKPPLLLFQIVDYQIPKERIKYPTHYRRLRFPTEICIADITDYYWARVEKVYVFVPRETLVTFTLFKYSSNSHVYKVHRLRVSLEFAHVLGTSAFQRFYYVLGYRVYETYITLQNR